MPSQKVLYLFISAIFAVSVVFLLSISYAYYTGKVGKDTKSFARRPFPNILNKPKLNLKLTEKRLSNIQPNRIPF